MSTVLIEIRFKPLIHPLYPILYLRAGSILEIFFQTGGVCIRASHITRLHLFVPANSLFARGTLYAVYKVLQLYRTGMSDIINPKGNLVIHEGRECQVMTNSPTYDKQLTLNDYWQQIGGLVMLPGTNRASDRFVRASFYIHAIPQTSNFRVAVAGVFSVMRNVSVPLGITTPDQPNISSTRWRTVADQKNKVYYFESTLSPDIFWVDFKSLDFKAGTPIKKLTLTNGEIYAGNTAKDFKDSKPLPFLFGI